MRDPEEERYRRDHPRFPGVAESVRLLELRSTRGSYLDMVLHDLREHAPEVLDEVTDAVDREDDDHVRALLVGQLAEARDPRLVGFFARLLDDPAEPVAHWAREGLRLLDTKDARRALFRAEGQRRG